MRRKPVLTTLALRGVADDEAGKKLFHCEARRALRNLAGALGYDRSDYELRSTAGGPAVSGEVILHADEVYVQVSCNGGGGEIMYRRVQGRRDHLGDRNHYAAMCDLGNPGALAERICRDLGLQVPEFDNRLVA